LNGAGWSSLPLNAGRNVGGGNGARER